MPAWFEQFLPILILLAVVALILWRLPKTEIEHSDAFRKRRFFNWFPLGMTYAFLYMGRYNLTVAKTAFAEMGLMTNADFGEIFGIGAITYGVAFLINGPLCDRLGGRFTILTAVIGSSVLNLAMGLVIYMEWTSNLKLTLALLYSANMYFQSFGAVSVVKVNAAWFHVRERGVLGGIFGILISLGIYFAFDWNGMILNASKSEAVPAGNPYWVFLVPAVILVVMFFIDWVLVRDEPAGAGHENFDLGDATSGEDDTPDPLGVVVKRMLGSSVILTIAGIEFCSGYLRNATMHWGSIYSKQTGIADQFVFQNWGLMMCCAGIMAGMFSGIISDYVFNSRRGPVAAILYFGLTVGSGLILALLGSPAIGWALIFMQLCVIGVHGMLSGTASADFGGKKNAGVAVGLIDACVYLGTGTQSFLLGAILPDGEAAKDPSNWTVWPIALMPLAIVGTLLALRIWNAKPQPTKAAAAT